MRARIEAACGTPVFSVAPMGGGTFGELHAIDLEDGFFETRR